MFAPSGDYSESRPFKIFISLLDKWEIGAALTDVLVYDALRAIKQFVELKPDTSEDVRQYFIMLITLALILTNLKPKQMVMTASALYEAVEPHVVWKQLLAAFIAEITGNGNNFEVRGSSDSVNHRFHR